MRISTKTFFGLSSLVMCDLQPIKRRHAKYGKNPYSICDGNPIRAVTIPHPERRSEQKFPTAHPSIAGHPKAMPRIGLSAAEILTLDTSNASRYLLEIIVVTKKTAVDIKNVNMLFLLRNFFITFHRPINVFSLYSIICE